MHFCFSVDKFTDSFAVKLRAMFTQSYLLSTSVFPRRLDFSMKEPTKNCSKELAKIFNYRNTLFVLGRPYCQRRIKVTQMVQLHSAWIHFVSSNGGVFFPASNTVQHKTKHSIHCNIRRAVFILYGVQRATIRNIFLPFLSTALLSPKMHSEHILPLCSLSDLFWPQFYRQENHSHLERPEQRKVFMINSELNARKHYI